MVVPREVFKWTQKCFQRENSKELLETIQWHLPKSNLSVLVLTYRVQTLVLVKDKWPLSWILTKISTVIEISTALQSLLERLFPIWVSEGELNQLVWEFITAPRKFLPTPIKLQSSESAPDWKEKLLFSKVSVMSDTGWRSSLFRRVLF